MRNRVSSSDQYFAFLSIKYEVDPDEFFHALVSAGENQKSTCGGLSIECRGKTHDRATFLILKGSEVVAQFPISTESLSAQNNPIKKFTQTDMIRRYLAKKYRKAQSRPIRDLRTGMSNVSLKAKILEISGPKPVVTRFGNSASVASALIADETGTIKLCLWNEQINCVSIGDTIQVRNARMSTFRGEKQLSIGKKGTLSAITDASAQLEVLSS